MIIAKLIHHLGVTSLKYNTVVAKTNRLPHFTPLEIRPSHKVSRNTTLRAVYHVPPRLLIPEKSDGSGTTVIYHLLSSIPSSIMAAEHNLEFFAAAKILGKIDQLVAKVTKVISE